MTVVFPREYLYICDGVPTSVTQRARCHHSSPTRLSLCVAWRLSSSCHSESSVTLPSNVFKAKHKPFHTDTCQKSTLYIQTCLRRGSSEYSRFNTHNVNGAFPLTLKTPFHVSAAAANVIWCMITSVLKYKCQKLWILYWCNLHGEHDLCLWLLCFLPVVEKIHPLSLHRRLEMLDDTKNAFACFQREILNFHGWDVNLHTALQLTLVYLNWITWYLKCMCWACNTYCITHL